MNVLSTMMVAGKNWRLMASLFKDVLRFNPVTMIATLGLMLVRNLSSGVGLLLILPLLQVIGVTVGHTDANGITRVITRLFHYAHLPLNLPTILISYVAVVSLIALAAYAEQITSTRLQQEYIHYLRAKLYRNIVHTTWPFFLQQKTSNLLHSLTTKIESISASNYFLLTLLNNALLLCVYTGLSFLLSWQMTSIAIISAVLLLGTMLPLHRLTSQAGSDHLQQNQDIMQSIVEQLGALKMIKGSGFEDKFIDETQRISSSLEQQNQKLTKVTAVSKLVYGIGSVLIFSALLYVALTLLAMPVASLLLLLVVFSRLLPMVSSIQQNYQYLLHQLPSYCEVQDLLEKCLVHQEDTTAIDPLLFNEAITVKNLSFSYPSSPASSIIENLSLTIKKNTTTAIIGPSGIGKSTLADLIIGLLEPTSGSISIDQRPLNRQHKLAWRKSVAYVTQDTFLFNASIRHNLKIFCAHQSDEALWTVLRLVAAADFVAELPQGLDTIIGDRGVRLSGGERQRIALARALLTHPQLLVLDESTSSLDQQNILKIQETLAQLRGQMTILIISHQVEMSDFADQ